MARWWEANLDTLTAVGVWEDRIVPKLTQYCCHPRGVNSLEPWTWCEHCPQKNKNIALREIMVITEDVESLLKLEEDSA